MSQEWKCAAQPYAVVPSDCNWPHCGCDPNVDRVIQGLQECGWEILSPEDIKARDKVTEEEAEQRRQDNGQFGVGV